MTDGFRFKTYDISVPGYGVYGYHAVSRGRALADAWRSFSECRDISFKEFLRIAHCGKGHTDHHEYFGKEITVGGRLAFFIDRNNQYVQFCYMGGSEYFNAHPYDVEPAEVRPWTYRDREAA